MDSDKVRGKEAVKPAGLRQHSRKDPQPSAGTGGKSLDQWRRGLEAIVGPTFEKFLDPIFPFRRLEAADGIDEASSRPHPVGRPGEQFCLEKHCLLDDRWPGAIEDLGMAAESAGSGTGCVEKDRVKPRLGRPVQRIGNDDVGFEPRALEIG